MSKKYSGLKVSYLIPPDFFQRWFDVHSGDVVEVYINGKPRSHTRITEPTRFYEGCAVPVYYSVIEEKLPF